MCLDIVNLSLTLELCFYSNEIVILHKILHAFHDPAVTASLLAITRYNVLTCSSFFISTAKLREFDWLISTNFRIRGENIEKKLKEVICCHDVVLDGKDTSTMKTISLYLFILNGLSVSPGFAELSLFLD